MVYIKISFLHEPLDLDELASCIRFRGTCTGVDNHIIICIDVLLEYYTIKNYAPLLMLFYVSDMFMYCRE